MDDRGFHYGDGLFETIAFPLPNLDLANHPLLPYHETRLHKGCERLSLDKPSLAVLRQELAQIHRQLGTCLIKVMVTRRQSQRGYPATTSTVNRTVLGYKGASLPLNQPVDVARSEVVLSEQPMLAGLKHLNRLENILASRDIQGAVSEVLLCNQQGFVIEGTKSNIFVYDGQWLTPKLDKSGVAGVSRAWLIEHMRKQGLAVTETTIPYDALEDAQSLFITNSVIGVCAVKHLDGKEKDTRYVEPIKQLIESLWS